MREFLIIFKQAFLTKAKTKSFLLTSLITIAAVFLLANMPKIIDSVKDMTGSGGEGTLQVIDETGTLFNALEKQFEETKSTIQVEESKKSEEQLTRDVEEGRIHAFLVLSIDDTKTVQAKYVSMSAMDIEVPMKLRDALQTIQTGIKATELSLAPEQVQTLFTPIQFEQKSVSPSSKTEEELSQARGLVYVLMFLIYFAVIMYSNMIATEVATEKSSRVMEILISSVSPVKHMFAKVLGIGTLGLLQMVLFGVSGYIALKTASSEQLENQVSAFGFSNIDVGTIVYAIIFFLLGYFLFAVLAAFLGSLVSRTEDVQQMILPITFLIIIGFIIAASGLGNPDTAYVKYASFFPFFAPLVMFLRVGMLDLPVWEPVVAIGIMIITIVILGSFGARVYRGGVLMYGPSRSLKDMKRAIQLGKE